MMRAMLYEAAMRVSFSGRTSKQSSDHFCGCGPLGPCIQTRYIALFAKPNTEQPNTQSGRYSYSGGHGPGKHIALHGDVRLSENILS
jgi:hypothetical protein